MSLAGIREMSTITTPPEERHPILTYVGAYDDKLVAAAIRRELLRDGQVFFVHNRVSDIEAVTRRLREAVPEARIAVAHGQMNEDPLEQVINGFWEREYDVLVCTTIVETGLDISNANTLIVDHSEILGLSQMHQLRGRVGRGRERGYAYFLYPPERTLTETAHDRLATIAQNAELGAGLAVAMKDLEIRGAGSILGAEQSGHIAGVGFDLYVRLVGEAVTAFKKAAGAAAGDGDEEEPPEVRIELPVDANIPHDYIPSERLRLDAYRRIAAAVGRRRPCRRFVPSCSTGSARCPSRWSDCCPSPPSATSVGSGRDRGGLGRQRPALLAGGPAGVWASSVVPALSRLGVSGGQPHRDPAAANRVRHDRLAGASRCRAAGVLPDGPRAGGAGSGRVRAPPAAGGRQPVEAGRPATTASGFKPTTASGFSSPSGRSSP